MRKSYFEFLICILISHTGSEVKFYDEILEEQNYEIDHFDKNETVS